MKSKNIAVLMGGWSQEREISINSGKNISNILKGIGYNIYEIDIKKDLRYIVDELYKSDPFFIFNMVHGIGGEDGVLQGILDVFGVPYSNSNLLSSSISFDKSICKKLVKYENIRVAEGFDISIDDIKNINTNNGIQFEYPFVVKPCANGSTVGIFLIFNESDLNKLKDTDWTFGDRILIEKYIDGREFTVLVINGKSIGAIEITYKNILYDYESKYEIGGSSHISSFEMNEYAFKEMLEMAEKSYRACLCKGIARADFRYDEKDTYFIEINTIPGMTELSLVPDIAKFNGISMEELLESEIKGYL